MNIEIAIRAVQHYMYCPHRWGLMEIDRAWAENYFVTKANLMHENVHDPGNHHFSRGKKIYTAVPVYLDDEEHNLYGVVDCLEVMEKRETEKNEFRIVEYKPTKPRNRDFNEDDVMQIFAQKLCVDYVFGCDCDTELYYGDVKKRYSLPLKENYDIYDDKLKSILAEMREFLKRGEIPAINKGQKCSGCSMKDLCMPKIRRFEGVRKAIAQINAVSERTLEE